MNKFLTTMMLVGVLGWLGCEKQNVPGGPGARAPANGEGTPANQEAVRPEATFSLDVPNTATTVERGATDTVTIGIDRGSQFDQAVVLKFDGVPDGVMLEPMSPVLQKDMDKVEVSIMAGENAETGEFTIKVRGVPETGAEGSSEFTVNVRENGSQ